jgi:hypothetical protein
MDKYTKEGLIEIWKESSRKLGSDKLDIFFEDLAQILNNIDSKPKKVLEIGIQRGGNVSFLLQVLPAGSTVVGIDIHLPQQKLPKSIQFIKGSSLDTKVIAEVSKLGPYDLIVEDASHIQSHVCKNLDNYAPMLKINGIMIIEDTQCAILPGWGRGIYGRKNILNHYTKSYYKNLTFQRKNQVILSAKFNPYSIVFTRMQLTDIYRMDSSKGSKEAMLKPDRVELLKKILYLKYEQKKPYFIFLIVSMLLKIRNYLR